MLLFEVPSHALRERLWKVLISTLICNISSHTVVYCAAQGKLKHVSYSIVASYIRDHKGLGIKISLKNQPQFSPTRNLAVLVRHNQTK